MSDKHEEMTGVVEKTQSKKRSFTELEGYDSDVVVVETQGMTQFIKSKRDMYNYYAYYAQCHVEPYHKVKVQFLRDVMGGKKKLLKVNDIKPLNVPKYPELAVKEIFDKIKHIEQIMKYMPDLKEGKFPERNWFFGVRIIVHGSNCLQVISTLMRSWLIEEIENQQKNRKMKHDKDNQGNFILVKQKFLEELESSGMYSSVRGRAVFMLQQKSKTASKTDRKKRQKFSYKSQPQLDKEESILQHQQN